jgi:hypothetical protein
MIVWLVLTWFVVMILVAPDIYRVRTKRRRARAEDMLAREAEAAVQILFASHEGPTIALDCILLEPLVVDGRTLQSGFPISLHFEPLSDTTLSTAACNVIARWADEDRTVSMHLIVGDGPPRVKLTDDETTLQLDLEGAYG